MRSVVKRSDVVKQNLCTKNINGINYTANDYGYVKSSTGKSESPKYKIIDEFDCEFYVGKPAWESKNVVDTTTKNSPLHPDGKRFKDNHKQVQKVEIVEEKIETPKLVELFPMPLLLPAPQSDLEFLQNFVADILSKEVEGISEKEIEEIREEKDVYSLFVFLFSDCKKENSKKYYRILATRLHPDKHGNEQWFKYLQEVYNWAKERGYAL